MSPADLELLRRVRQTQLAVKARGELDYVPWATWGYKGGWLEKEFGPFVTLNGPTDEDRESGQRLIDTGLLDGCMCGCRGDMKVTHKGLRLLGLNFDHWEEDDGHNPTTVFGNMRFRLDEPELDDFLRSL